MSTDEDREIDSMIQLSLSDAATNCQRDYARARLTLRSGVQLTGILKKSDSAFDTTAHMSTEGGGWITLLIAEVVAVEAVPKGR